MKIDIHDNSAAKNYKLLNGKKIVFWIAVFRDFDFRLRLWEDGISIGNLKFYKRNAMTLGSSTIWQFP